MATRRQDKTTLLPQALRDRIEEQGGSSKHMDATSHSHNSYSKQTKKGKSRKALREEERAAKKRRKAEYFSQRPSTKDTTANAKRKGEEDANDRPVKQRRLDTGAHPVEKTVQKTPPEANSKPGSMKKKREQEKVSSPPPNKRQTSKGAALKAKSAEQRVNILPVPPVERDEDKEIAWLEYQLGIGSRKKSSRGSTSYVKLLKEDGLDDLLDGLDDILGGADDVHASDENSSGKEDGGEEEEDDLSEYDEDAEVEGAEVEDDQDVSMESGPDDGTSDSEEKSNDAASVKSGVSPTEKSMNASRYVPPHLRAAAPADDENCTRLLRQLKGLMNRLSEQNIGAVITELEEIYRQHTRYDVTSSLASVIIDAISSNASLLDNHIALNASLVAALYRIVGIEFGAYFVQEVVKAYESAYSKVENQQQDASDANAVIVGKDAQNLLVCIAELYNFEVISCVLMSDIVRALLKQSMGELEVELLLKILRIGGRQLRQDDPLALKDIVQLVTENVSSRKGALSSRTRYMVETLTNLKNNRIKKTNTSSVDNVGRMKKMLAGLTKKQHGSHEPLRITLADLHSAESKGKWWLVGAGWAGDPLADIQRSKDAGAEPQAAKTVGAHPVKGPTSKSKEKVKETESESERLLRLARAQGMNTDIRRSVFVVLMSSDDYVDACDRLSQLSLTEQQQREIVRVQIHCCGNEKAYNPYYALVGQRLLATSHAHRITAQFILWDFLRSIGETGIGQRDSESFDSATTVSASRTRNMAKLYAWLISRGSLSIAVLRPIEFGILQTATLGFLDTLFYDVFINTQGPTPILSRTGLGALWQRGDASFIGKEKYERSAIVEMLMPATRDANLSRGLVVYLGKFVKRKVGQGEDGERRFFGWAVGVAKEVLELGSIAESVKESHGIDWEE